MGTYWAGQLRIGDPTSNAVVAATEPANREKPTPKAETKTITLVNHKF